VEHTLADERRGGKVADASTPYQQFCLLHGVDLGVIAGMAVRSRSRNCAPTVCRSPIVPGMPEVLRPAWVDQLWGIGGVLEAEANGLLRVEPPSCEAGAARAASGNFSGCLLTAFWKLPDHLVETDEQRVDIVRDGSIPDGSDRAQPVIASGVGLR